MRILKLIILFSISLTGLSQELNIQGFIIDSRNKPINSAIIELNSDNNHYGGITNDSGLFEIQNLKAGIYDININHPDYSQINLTSYHLNNDTILNFRIYNTSFEIKKESNNNDLIGNIYIAESGDHFFKILNKRKVLWVSISDVGDNEPIEIKGKYDFKNNFLRITIKYKVDRFVEAKTYYLLYDMKNNLFQDPEYSINYINTKKVVYGENEYFPHTPASVPED